MRVRQRPDPVARPYTPAVSSLTARWRSLMGLGVIGLGAVIVSLIVIRPFDGAPIAYDAAASVIHFERIAGGIHLEGGLSTTPKPLLTLIFGLIYDSGAGWLGISLATIAAWGVAVAAAAYLCSRIAGPVAGVAVALSLIGARIMVPEVAGALGLVWALLCWVLAGLAATAGRPRWGLAGILLGLGALARLETFLVLGLAFALLVLRRVGPAGVRGPVPSGVWRLMIGWAALPVMLIHDWALTGNPMYWTTVAAAYSVNNRPPSPLMVIEHIGLLIVSMPFLAVPAAVGAVSLMRGRSVPLAVGLAALGPGVAVFLVVLAARHLFVDPRYYAPIELSIIVAAAIGLAVTVKETGRFARERWPDRRPLAASVTAASAALVVAAAGGHVIDRATLDKVDVARAYMRTAALALPVLRAEVLNVPDAAGLPGTSRLTETGVPGLFLVPTPIRPQIVVDLDVGLRRVEALPAASDSADWVLHPGQLLVLNRRDIPAEVYRGLASDEPVKIGTLHLVPLFADPAAGTWVVRVDGATS
jgi:hypothetical protein